MQAHEEAFCPVYQRGIELLGSRWTGAIVRALLGGRCRFSDITAAIPGLSDRMLVERLRELEAEGIVTRSATPGTAPRVEYRLTERGRALSTVIEALVDWLRDWAADAPAPLYRAAL